MKEEYERASGWFAMLVDIVQSGGVGQYLVHLPYTCRDQLELVEEAVPLAWTLQGIGVVDWNL